MQMTNKEIKLKEQASFDKSIVVPTHNRWKSVKISSLAFVLIGLAVFLGTCQVSKAAGWWSTDGKVTLSGGAVILSGTNPSEIKGSMLIKDVLSAYKVSMEEFRAKFNIPAEVSPDALLNTIEKSAPDFSVTKLRAWLTERAQK
jgi:hypothetical protein